MNRSMAASFSATVGNVTNPYLRLDIFGLRATTAGTKLRDVTDWNSVDSMSSVTNCDGR